MAEPWTDPEKTSFSTGQKASSSAANKEQIQENSGARRKLPGDAAAIPTNVCHLGKEEEARVSLLASEEATKQYDELRLLVRLEGQQVCEALSERPVLRRALLYRAAGDDDGPRRPPERGHVGEARSRFPDLDLLA
ncbi:hypothetical protein EYF80_014807 [Liparis tanakae]|uniref:Uncharacterized protein n=1 Tax=Liparis tanakae TaxID=230148 RepID=A0A4Z2IBH6_9TELE|nr:hypothetical protein EYF80_014807 [Liparis tanakae]